MNALFTIIAAIIIFAVLIFVHEFGHFIAAKSLGVKVNEFAIGMGPKLLSKQKGETLYSVRAIPIGGFCAMEGEDEATDDERSFSNKKPWKRLVILVAGAAMNILLGFILLVGICGMSEGFAEPKIEKISEDSAAEMSGLRANDEIIRANGRRVNIVEDFYWEIENNTNPDGTLELVVKNDGEKREITVTPKETDGKKTYGILLSVSENSFFKTIENAYFKTAFYSRVVIDSLFNMIRGKIPLSQVSGPVGIVHEIGTAVEAAQSTGLEGIIRLIGLAVLLAVNLGVFNLLPLPALDGGRILFVLIEMIRRKPIPKEKEAVVHFVGIVLLLGLSVIIAFKDIFTIRW